MKVWSYRSAELHCTFKIDKGFSFCLSQTPDWGISFLGSMEYCIFSPYLGSWWILSIAAIVYPVARSGCMCLERYIWNTETYYKLLELFSGKGK